MARYANPRDTQIGVAAFGPVLMIRIHTEYGILKYLVRKI